jgi:hypothetical protein
VARDLRILEVDLLMRHLSSGRMDNLESLVDASCELYFRSGTLRFSRLADYQLTWETPPTVTVVLTLASQVVTVSFLLHIAANEAAVELQYVSFPPRVRPHQQARLLERAFRRARRPELKSLAPGGRRFAGGECTSWPARPTQVCANIVD